MKINNLTCMGSVGGGVINVKQTWFTWAVGWNLLNPPLSHLQPYVLPGQVACIDFGAFHFSQKWQCLSCVTATEYPQDNSKDGWPFTQFVRRGSDLVKPNTMYHLNPYSHNMLHYLQNLTQVGLLVGYYLLLLLRTSATASLKSSL